MQVAIFGAAGQLGVELVQEFSKRGHTVHSFRRSDVDITDTSQLEAKLASLEIDLVLNSAAYNKVDVAENEPQAAYAVPTPAGPKTPEVRRTRAESQ